MSAVKLPTIWCFINPLWAPPTEMTAYSRACFKVPSNTSIAWPSLKMQIIRPYPDQQNNQDICSGAQQSAVSSSPCASDAHSSLRTTTEVLWMGNRVSHPSSDKQTLPSACGWVTLPCTWKQGDWAWLSLNPFQIQSSKNVHGGGGA